MTVVSAATIRTTAFGMQKGGYSTVHVDAARERLVKGQRPALDALEEHLTAAGA